MHKEQMKERKATMSKNTLSRSAGRFQKVTLAHAERHLGRNKKVTGANRYPRLCEWVVQTLTENPWGPPRDFLKRPRKHRHCPCRGWGVVRPKKVQATSRF